jgi:hypothetical protein
LDTSSDPDLKVLADVHIPSHKITTQLSELANILLCHLKALIVRLLREKVLHEIITFFRQIIAIEHSAINN